MTMDDQGLQGVNVSSTRIDCIIWIKTSLSCISVDKQFQRETRLFVALMQLKLRQMPAKGPLNPGML